MLPSAYAPSLYSANMIKGKTPEEIRKLFNIQNDFSPEEEAQIRKENVSRDMFELMTSSRYNRARFRSLTSYDFSSPSAFASSGMGRRPLSEVANLMCIPYVLKKLSGVDCTRS